jgi:ABC-type lipoprotein export system ATPase subunit
MDEEGERVEQEVVSEPLDGAGENGRAVVLEARNLYHVYESKQEDGNVVALRGLSVEIHEAEVVAVVGPSGSGKSTLLKALGGLMKPSAGSVFLGGNNMTRLTGPELVKVRQETVSFIFQEGNLLPDMNALDNVAQPLRHAGVRAKKARQRAMEMLTRLGVEERAYAMPAQLSGGEAQRVAVGRALITEPRVLLADEPTGSVDPITGRRIIEMFRQLNEESGVAFLIVTHSREIAAFADRALELRDGRFVAQHGSGVSDDDLAATRELLLDDTGTLSMPPDVMTKLGGPGRFEVSNLTRNVIQFDRVASERIDLDEDHDVVLVLAPACPACTHYYGSSDAEECPECGSSRPLVESNDAPEKRSKKSKPLKRRRLVRRRKSAKSTKRSEGDR